MQNALAPVSLLLKKHYLILVLRDADGISRGEDFAPLLDTT